ncbi:MAG: thioredoxin family protein [Candidatus Didemnitutus sp.]|nr:thioredoxin family protein [Candidatus Didemnitutus sp.]
MKTKLLSLVLAAALTPLALLAAATKGAEPAVVSHGERIDLAALAVPGKITVVDFTSQYCPPCRGYTEPLHRLHAKRADIAVVKVDINRPGVKGIDWKSPVTAQFQLRSIPHFKVFGPDGKLLAEDMIKFGPDGQPVVRESKARAMVDQWIAALK